MEHAVAHAAEHAAEEAAVYDKTLFGFWVYIMTDCILFGTLFATYLVLHKGTFGGPTSKDLFDLNYALGETFALLASSFTCGLAMLGAHENNKKKLLFWYGVTFLLGATFVAMEFHEFSSFVEAGNSWKRSGFLTGFFTLVGTHGCHVSIALIWMIVLLIPVIRNGITNVSYKRLNCLRLFWHFLDVVWIFIFTIVYLMGAST